MSNIKAAFSGGANTITAHGLHQWDYGRILEISHPDLPALIEVHFANAGAKDAIVRVTSSAAGVASVAIPDSLLEQTSPIHAWVYVVSETAGETVLTVIMPVVKRPRPTAAEPVPEEISDKYTQALGAINAEVDSLRKGGVIVAKALTANDADRATKADNATKALNANVAVYADEAGVASEARSALQDALGNYIHETYVTFGLAFAPISAGGVLPTGSYQFKVRISDMDYYATLEVPGSGTSAAVIHVSLGITPSSPIQVTRLVVTNGVPAVKLDSRDTDGSSVNNTTDITNSVSVLYRKIH